MEEEKSDNQAIVATPKIPRAKAAGIALLLLASTSFGLIGGWIGSSSRSGGALEGTRESGQAVVTSEGELISEVAEEVGPSVVSINVISQERAQDLFGFNQEYEQESAGTGFIISEDGIIVTNRHVIPSGTTEVSITLSDGTELEDIEVIGRTGDSDPLDIAFLRVKDKKGKELRSAKLGDSSKVEVGHRVIAIGNALGYFQNTVTSGIISGYGRSVEAADENGSDTLQNLFQTDAAINRGNSGGPLVNASGEVIGINTAVASGSAQNIGFAIPINDVQGLIKSVLTNGKLERPYLGVRYINLTDDYAYQFNLSVKRGAYIVPSRSNEPSILPGSPAEKAGLKEGDVITAVDGKTVDQKNSLISLIGRRSVGDEITLAVVREGGELAVKLSLEAAPED